MTQFLQIHPQNPQQRLIRLMVDALQKGVVVYPTDSYYALGFLLNNNEAAARVRQMRGLDDSHLFTLSCRNVSEIGDYGSVDTAAFRIIKQHVPGPYTFVLKALKKNARHLCHPRRKTIAFRVPSHPVAQALLEEANAPIITTTLCLRDSDPMSPEDFRERLAGIVDAVADAGECSMIPTTVIDFSETPPRLLRQGGGKIDEQDILE
ncbi:MAG: L-threonylcarbamoyladenylate synthase [Gammaproteobacteria bacterium WSBS_2016_MAG_OTU1]